MAFDFSRASDLKTSTLSYFSGRSEDYAKYRPIHPAAAIDKLLSGLDDPTHLVAADVGAGTGIGAGLLADRGIRVLAIEPNADMRASATPHERVEFCAGTAETIPLGTASVDLVTSFQAFHWFDFERSLQEFQRVLKPGGRLALIWSLWDPGNAASKAYMRLIFEASNDSGLQPRTKFSVQSLINQLRYQVFWRGLWLPYFIDFQRREFKFNQKLDLPGLLGLAHSQGFTPTEGIDREKLISGLSKFHHHFANDGAQVRLAYQTRLYLATSPSS